MQPAPYFFNLGISQSEVLVTAIVHSKELRSNIVEDYWPGSVTFKDIEAGSYHIFDLRKEVKVHLNVADDPCVEDEGYSKEECVVGLVRKKIMDGASVEGVKEESELIGII